MRTLRTMEETQLAERQCEGKSCHVSVKFHSALDKIIEKVPKPKGAVPAFGLPKWKHMPLNMKIPMIRAPKGAYNITRKKLGKKLWVQTRYAEFDLNDPYNREIQFTYDPLHDEHLARYFSRARNTRRLLKLGFINKDRDAICTLKDYNMYRAFLQKLHADSINKELKRQQDLHNERRILGFAETNAKREIDGLKKAERRTLAREETREKLRLMKERKMREQRDLAERLRQRFESMELAKEEEKRARVLKSRARTERARRKRAAISEIQRDRVIKNLTEWARKEANLRKARRERSARQAEEKRRAIEETWKRREEEEESEIARKQSALRYAEEERDKFIKSYESKVQRERFKFQKRVRNYRRFLDCYLGRKSLGPVIRSCCRKLKKQKKLRKTFVIDVKNDSYAEE